MLDIHEVFPAAKPSGTGFMDKCPVHDDKTASLSITPGDDGRWLLHCHAGCEVDAILDAKKLTWSDLFPPNENGGSRRPPNGNSAGPRRIEKVYDYHTATGDLLFQVVRFEPKDFRQRRPDGTGGYIWSVKGLDRVVYRLPKIKGHPAVFITEGEKDADRVASIGLPATTCSGGAEKWRDDYARQLVDAGVQRVAILLDNDAAGRRHADQVAASCQAAGLGVRIVTLPGLPEKGDVSDFLNSHTTVDFLASTKDAPPYTGAEIRDEEPERPPGRTPVITWLNTVTPEEVSWLWPGRMARGKYQVLVGDPDLGKTTIALDCAARLSTGGTWPDGTACPQGKTLILTAEDGIADTIVPRIKKLGGDSSQVCVLEGVRDKQGTRPLNLKHDLDMLVAAIEEVRPALVIIDPISAYLGDTNSFKDSEVRGLLSPVKDILERYNVTLLAIAHLNKNQQQSVIHRTSGAVAFVAAARLGWVVAKDPNDDDRRILAMFKHNLCAKAPSLTYELDGGAVTWDLTAPDIDAETLLQSSDPEARSKQQDAVAFLEDILEDGPIKQTDLFQTARKNGIAESAIQRAKSKIGIKPSKQGYGKDSFWLWRLPTTGLDHLRSEIRKNPNETTKVIEGDQRWTPSFGQVFVTAKVESGS